MFKLILNFIDEFIIFIIYDFINSMNNNYYDI